MPAFTTALIPNILSHLPVDDLVAARVVNRQFYQSFRSIRENIQNLWINSADMQTATPTQQSVFFARLTGPAFTRFKRVAKLDALITRHAQFFSSISLPEHCNQMAALGWKRDISQAYYLEIQQVCSSAQRSEVKDRKLAIAPKEVAMLISRARVLRDDSNMWACHEMCGITWDKPFNELRNRLEPRKPAGGNGSYDSSNTCSCRPTPDCNIT